MLLSSIVPGKMLHFCETSTLSLSENLVFCSYPCSLPINKLEKKYRVVTTKCFCRVVWFAGFIYWYCDWHLHDKPTGTVPFAPQQKAWTPQKSKHCFTCVHRCAVPKCHGCIFHFLLPHPHFLALVHLESDVFLCQDCTTSLRHEPWHEFCEGALKTAWRIWRNKGTYQHSRRALVQAFWGGELTLWLPQVFQIAQNIQKCKDKWKKNMTIFFIAWNSQIFFLLFFFGGKGNDNETMMTTAHDMISRSCPLLVVRAAQKLASLILHLLNPSLSKRQSLFNFNGSTLGIILSAAALRFHLGSLPWLRIPSRTTAQPNDFLAKQNTLNQEMAQRKCGDYVYELTCAVRFGAGKERGRFQCVAHWAAATSILGHFSLAGLGTDQRAVSRIAGTALAL